jgi:hypothetical protein
MGLRGESSFLTALQKSADGIVGTRERAEGLNGGRESWPGMERRDGIRRGGERGSASGMNARLACREMTLRLWSRDYPDVICRTAGYVTRLSGRVGGGSREAPPYPDWWTRGTRNRAGNQII